MANSKVCVIGGGPAGLACVKTLNAEPIKNFSIDLYEIRPQVGGVWNYTPNKSNYHTQEELDNDNIKCLSPIYKSLETNIVRQLMAYKDFPFKTTRTFPKHHQVLDYLIDYSHTVGAANLFFNTEITHVEKIPNSTRWWVKLKNIITNQESNVEYDFVMVANGCFNIPYMPKIVGLESWQSHLIHAKFFELIEPYRNKKVLIIGGLSSGVDIALNLSAVAEKIYISVREGEKVIGQLDQVNPYIEAVAEVVLTDYATRTVTLKDNRILHDISDIFVCTGYLTGKSFIKLPIIHDHYIDELYHHIFWYQDPSLMFIGLPRNVQPFPMVELQASYAARYITGRLKLPDQSTMEVSYKNDFKDHNGKHYHDYKSPKDVEYFKFIQSIIKQQGLEDGFNSEVYEGDRLAMKLKSSDFKAERLREVSERIIKERRGH